MFFSSAAFKSTIRIFFIEGISLGMAFLADNLLQKLEEENPQLRLAIDTRVYYVSKNLLNLLDSLITRNTTSRHLYSGVFNMGVAVLLYPANRLPSLGNRIYQIIVSEGLIYMGASFFRLIIEKKLEIQTIKHHISVHRGKLLSGAGGVFLSLIPHMGRASPALYWSGEFYDLWQIKNDNETLVPLLMSPKSTVPLQVFFAQVIKVITRSLSLEMPFPEFSLDVILGTLHRLSIYCLDVCFPQAIPTTSSISGIERSIIEDQKGTHTSFSSQGSYQITMFSPQTIEIEQKSSGHQLTI